jgi:hypothetical protein
MKSHRSPSVTAAACRLVAIAFLLSGAALAQGGPPPGMGTPAEINPKRDSDAQRSREAALRSAELDAAASRMTQQRLAVAMEQTKQDFRRIQLIRNDLVDSLVAKKPLDYKQVSDRAAEINKRATRLKAFLMQPAAEEKKKDEAKPVEYDGEALKGALVRLCNLIYSFTSNPMFKEPAAVDLRQATRAGGDLLSIIELSDSVRMNADRLRKSSN